MNDLLKKLQFKDSKEMLVLNAPTSFQHYLSEFSENLTVHQSKILESYNFILAFVINKKELEKYASLIMPIPGDNPLLWFAYPKKSSKRYKSEINRDSGWEVLGKSGYEGVRQIAIDEDWSALRFRHVSKIKSLERNQSRALSSEGKKRLKRSV